MTTLTETGHSGGFLLSEANGALSRDAVTIVTGQNLKAGAVLGKITATGKYKAYDNAAADGSQAAAAILLDDTDATSADKTATAIMRYAEVSSAELVWGGTQTGPDKTAGLADLLALGIAAR